MQTVAVVGFMVVLTTILYGLTALVLRKPNPR
jgi:hypothetical protein